MSQISEEEMKQMFEYRVVKIGHPTYILGGRFMFSYSFHSIPCMRFEVEFEGKKFFFSGDTFYCPPELKKLYEKGIFSRERYEELANIDLTQYDLILHEAGIPPIHTPMETLKALPDKVKECMYLYHVAEKDMP